VLYIYIAKVDRDVTHVVMDIYICFKCIFHIFHMFQTNVALVLSGCCKNRSGCCIYMHVASICFKCFQVFHMYVYEYFIWMLHMFAMVFKCFSDVFTSVSDACFKCSICRLLYVATATSECFDVCFKCFICLLLYVAIVTSGCFKSRSGVTHGMSVRSGRRRGRCSGRRGPPLVRSLASLTRYALVCSLRTSAFGR
jgi:hypothetical protein